MMWCPFSILKRRELRRRPVARLRPALEELESRLLLSVNVLTYGYGIGNSDVNANETQLTPANVSSGSFGKLFSTPLDGQVYTQPLVDTGVAISNGPYTTSGAAGVHNVVFVATENDSLYAIDAGNSSQGAILWHRSFLDANDPNDALPGADSVTPVPYLDTTGSPDLAPVIGITGTPVIDPNTNTMYVIAATKETVGGVAHYVQRLHAINIADGSDVVAPYLIGDTTGDDTFDSSVVEQDNTPIYVYGDGEASITDPYNGSGQPVVQFNALHENQRSALRLVNGTLYAAWGSHGDTPPYFGWVAAWNVSNLTGNGWQLSGVLNASPNGGGDGIWLAGGGLSFEPDGSAFYFETANGRALPITLNGAGFPNDGNYPDAVVKVVADPNSTPQNQNTNGWGFKIVDYFVPYNEVSLDYQNLDLTSAPQLLPASAGIPGHANLLVAGGKEGKLYLIDRKSMGEFDPNNDNVLNSVPNGSGNNTPPALLNGILSTPAYFNGELYTVGGYNDVAKAFTINSDGTLSVVSQTSNEFGFEPGSPIISANGKSNAILWLMNRQSNELTAYDPSNLGDELWNSGQAADSLGSSTKFAVPTVANGMVFVGTANSLVAYGLAAANAVSQAPILSATSLSGTSINLTWQDPSERPNIASAYLIEESTDGVHFTQVTTAPQGATSLAIGGLTPGVAYSFRIRGLNSIGDSAYSNIVTATTSATLGVTIDFSSGFANSSAALTYNGSAAINGKSSQLTDGGANEAGSVFSNNPVDIDAFHTQFTFQIKGGAPQADGFTFTLQGVGPSALGLSGGGLGYGPDSTAGSGGIPQSVAIKFDLYSNEGEGNDSTGLYTDGAAPTDVGSINLNGSGINLHSDDVFSVNMSYDGTTLTVVITDTKTGASATQNYTLDIPSTVGGDTAYVGFTGGTGGDTATQDILNWTFSTNDAQAPAMPSGPSAAPASANSVVLNWTNNSTNQTGFYLDRATDAGFTQNLITEALPASISSFTDTANGLAPGGTYYYRVRAFNSAGSSANTAAFAVTIPPLPPSPTNPSIPHATSSEIDLSWTDNAGSLADGYQIYRSTNGSPFTLQVFLPSGSTSWRDTNVSPGTNYEYHIVAYKGPVSAGYADVGGATSPLPSPSPHPADPPATTTALNASSNLFSSLFQLELDGFLLVTYLKLASSNNGKSDSESSLDAQVFALWAAIQANPLYNTSLGNYALAQGVTLAQSSAGKK